MTTEMSGSLEEHQEGAGERRHERMERDPDADASGAKAGGGGGGERKYRFTAIKRSIIQAAFTWRLTVVGK